MQLSLNDFSVRPYSPDDRMWAGITRKLLPHTLLFEDSRDCVTDESTMTTFCTV